MEKLRLREVRSLPREITGVNEQDFGFGADFWHHLCFPKAFCHCVQVSSAKREHGCLESARGKHVEGRCKEPLIEDALVVEVHVVLLTRDVASRI